jgi:hypothetical protein
VKPTVTQAISGAEITLTSSAINNLWKLGNTTLDFKGQSFNVTTAGVYKAAATVGECQGEFSDGVNVVFEEEPEPEPEDPGEITGLEDPMLSIEIFPNPAQKEITIRSQPQSQIRILDVAGKEQINEITRVSESVIDISSFAAGMYFIIIKDGTQTHHSKFLKR